MIVSHSNMKSFQKCEMKFYFDVKLNLRPKEWPAPVAKGIFGHKLMEAIFENYFLHNDYDLAVKAGEEKLLELLGTNPNAQDLDNAKTFRQCVSFLGYVVNQPWKIIAVEANENWEVEDDANFGFTPDLIIEWTSGPKKGVQAVIDYKFTGQYWNDRQINTVQQMPKYIIYRNKIHNGNIRYAGIIMLNTRAAADATGTAAMLMKWVPISKAKLKNIERENEILVRRLEPFFHMTPEEYKAQAVRTTDEYACKMCWYADDLCPQDLNDLPIENTIKANYVVNDYGYN